MVDSFIRWINYLVLAYVILMELQILVVAVASFIALQRDQFSQRHGRIRDLATSDTTPPISIIMAVVWLAGAASFGAFAHISKLSSSSTGTPVWSAIFIVLATLIITSLAGFWCMWRH